MPSDQDRFRPLLLASLPSRPPEWAGAFESKARLVPCPIEPDGGPTGPCLPVPPDALLEAF